MKKLWPIILLLTLVLTSLQSAHAKPPYGRFAPSSFSNHVVLIPWNSDEGRHRLERAEFKTDFFQLAGFFQPQINPLYCGIASSTIVLNTLRQSKGEAPSQAAMEVAKPQVWGGKNVPYPAYSQFTLLNEKTDKVKPREIIELKNITPENTRDAKYFDPGLSLAHLKGILEVYGLKVDISHADLPETQGVEKFRAQVQRVLGDSHSFLVANFKGKTFGAPTGGHISPLAAYDGVSDSVLILDVAGHKNPWYWVPIRDLYLGMHTRDGKTYRGWIRVEESQK